MPLPDQAYVAALNTVRGFGSKTVAGLVNSFGSGKAAWTAEEGQIRSRGFTEAVAARLVSGRKKINVEQLYHQVLAQGIKLLTVFEPEYPHQLKSIPNPPAVLYVKGSMPQCSLNVAVVGTRMATVYGTKTARALAAQLAGSNVCIVSGMARGIDTSAHQGAIDVKGSTVAVLGCGVDVIYPPENKTLAKEIQQHGALVSEFPLGTPPERGNFPARNRIISGLSHAVVIVEAPLKSGALITADFALDQGREVFAVPGPISSKSSRGCNQLIKDGARLLLEVKDIWEELLGVSAVALAQDASALEASPASSSGAGPSALEASPASSSGVEALAATGALEASAAETSTATASGAGTPAAAVSAASQGAGSSPQFLDSPGQETDSPGQEIHSPGQKRDSLDSKASHSLDPKTAQILHLLSGGPVFPDELCARCGMSTAELNILITKLELKGLVFKSGGRIFSLNNH